MKRKELKKIRIDHDESQAEFGARLGMNRDTYARIENGVMDGSLQQWKTIKTKLGISAGQMWELMTGEKE